MSRLRRGMNEDLILRNRSPKTIRAFTGWVANVWSYFRRAPGADEKAENMTREGAANHGSVRDSCPSHGVPSDCRRVFGLFARKS